MQVVFTVADSLAAIASQNQKVVYGILFQPASETPRRIALAPSHLGASIGFLGVLHTWGQNLQHHSHIHCIVPGGGISPEQDRLIRCRDDFFLPVRVLSRLHRRLLLHRRREANAVGKLNSHGRLHELNDPERFTATLKASRKTEWS